MKMYHVSLLVLINTLFGISVSAQTNQAQNPIIWADVPDMSVIRVDHTFYMSSTTMHMSPGVPIMKSEDLVNWKIVNYAYDILDNGDAMRGSALHVFIPTLHLHIMPFRKHVDIEAKICKQEILAETVERFPGVPREPVINNLFFGFHFIFNLSVKITKQS